MTRDEIRLAIIAELANIAPETDPSAIGSTDDVREALDIDSMDFLNFIIGLHKELDVALPERDYGRLLTLAGCVDYLRQALQRP